MPYFMQKPKYLGGKRCRLPKKFFASMISGAWREKLLPEKLFTTWEKPWGQYTVVLGRKVFLCAGIPVSAHRRTEKRWPKGFWNQGLIFMIWVCFPLRSFISPFFTCPFRAG